MAATTTRRPKLHPHPPPPPPVILHLPRRSRRPSSKPTPTTNVPLQALFQQERSFSVEQPPIQHPPQQQDGDHDNDQEQPWRLQAEILRAECNFLRMERHLAQHNLRRTRSRYAVALRSALHALSSLDGNRKVGAVLQELQGELESLQSRGTPREGVHRRRSGGGGNFDTKALVLRRRLHEMNVREMMPKAGESTRRYDLEKEGETSVREIAEDTNCTRSDSKASALPEVEILRRKMDRISTGMLGRVEHGSILLSSPPPTNTPATSGTMNSIRDISTVKTKDDSTKLEKARADAQLQECNGRCREVVERVVEQVRAETEQWSEMQGMLEQVGEEMDDLRCGKDFWERCALQSEQRLRQVNCQMMEWKRRAQEAESEATELRKKLILLDNELADARRDAALFRPPPTAVVKSRSAAATSYNKGDSLKDKEEKHALFCRFLDENFPRPKPVSSGRRRRPVLRDIGNI